MIIPVDQPRWNAFSAWESPFSKVRTQFSPGHQAWDKYCRIFTSPISTQTLFFEKRSPPSLHIVKNTVSDFDFIVMHNVRTISSFEIEGMPWISHPAWTCPEGSESRKQFGATVRLLKSQKRNAPGMNPWCTFFFTLIYASKMKHFSVSSEVTYAGFRDNSLQAQDDRSSLLRFPYNLD